MWISTNVVENGKDFEKPNVANTFSRGDSGKWAVAGMICFCRKSFEKKLHSFGIYTIGIWETDLEMLKSIMKTGKLYELQR